MITAIINRIIKQALNTRKGVNVKLSWERACKTKKACTDAITKRTDTVGRIGIDYSNRAVVKDMRANGDLPSQEQPIWHGKGQWVLFPYMFQHTITGCRYLRLYQGTGNAIPKVQFFRNGEPVSKESLSDVLLASEKGSKDTSLCFCVKIEDMLSIGESKALEIPQVKTEAVETVEEAEAPAETL